MTVIAGTTKQEFAKKVYAEKLQKKLYGGKPGHSVLVWGIAMNTKSGTIHTTPAFKYSDPSAAGSFPKEEDKFETTINLVYK